MGWLLPFLLCSKYLLEKNILAYFTKDLIMKEKRGYNVITRDRIHNISFSLKLTNGLHYTSLESLASDKHSSLLGSIVSYEENEVL